MSDDTRPGQSSNPRGQPHMRRLQSVLNSKYRREEDAVAVLDWMREQKIDDKRYITDREIIVEALIALGEKSAEGWQPKVYVSEQAVSEEILTAARQMRELAAMLSGLDFSQVQQSNPQFNADKFQQNVAALNDAISTSNLTGESHRYEGKEEEDWS